MRVIRYKEVDGSQKVGALTTEEKFIISHLKAF